MSPIKNKVSPLKKPTQPLILKKVNVITQPLANPKVQAHAQQITSEHVTLVPIKNLPSVSTKSGTTTTTTTHLTNFVPIAPAPKIIPLDSNSKVAFQALSNTSVASSIPLPVTVSSTAPPSNLNYKIFKVVRAPPLIKPKTVESKTSSISSIVIKLKSMEAYTTMMKELKLVHFYKCMGRDCHYTTDSLKLYAQHYHQHCEEVSNVAPPYDFQKCAYCYMTLLDWNNMKAHLWEKHSHCRYQCAYCFFRALVPSYVQQHQVI